MSITKHIPNTITCLNLVSGVLGVTFALQGRPQAAFMLMLAAAVFDFCDGLAARLLHAYSPIGKELDSLADMVSFGVLPTLMLYSSMGDSPARYVTLFLAAMSGLRLAKFNVDERQETDFIGVATPTAAMICGSLCCSLNPPSWVMAVVAVVLGLLLVSEVPMFGMKIKPGHKLLDAKRIVFLCLVAVSIIVTVVFRFHWSFAVLLSFTVYILENLLIAAVYGK